MDFATAGYIDTRRIGMAIVQYYAIFGPTGINVFRVQLALKHKFLPVPGVDLFRKSLHNASPCRVTVIWSNTEVNEGAPKEMLG